MTDVQRLRLALREKQSRTAALLAQDTRSNEEQAELRTLASEQADLTAQLAAAEASEQAELAQGTGRPVVDAETRERIGLRGRSTLGSYLMAALSGRLPGGAEAEYGAACSVEPGRIPIDLFERDRPAPREQADTTPAPTTGTGTTVAPVSPYLFAPSIAPRLGIEMPSVPSGSYSEMTITTALPASPKAKGAAADNTAAALTPVTASARRISTRLSLTIEDIAQVGAANFESALRAHASMRLSDELDNQIINGNGTAPNIEGLLAQLGAVTAPGAVFTQQGVLADIGRKVDGLWASKLSELLLLINPENYALFAASIFSGTAITLSNHLQMMLGSYGTNKRMPDTASTIAEGIVYRMGQAVRTACLPTWGSLSIDDIYTDSASGTRHFSMHVLVGSKVLLVQPDAYARVKTKLAM